MVKINVPINPETCFLPSDKHFKIIEKPCRGFWELSGERHTECKELPPLTVSEIWKCLTLYLLKCYRGPVLNLSHSGINLKSINDKKSVLAH